MMVSFLEEEGLEVGNKALIGSRKNEGQGWS